MSQIANQDYNVISPQFADCVRNDAAALGMLAGHLQRGTIFDVLINKYYDEADPSSRVISAAESAVFAYSGSSDLVACVNVPYAQTQYEGIAAVQVACELTNALPTFLSNEGNYLVEDNTSKLLCVDGKLVSVTDNEGHIASINVSENSPEIGTEWVNVPLDELRKLIGLPIAF